MIHYILIALTFYLSLSVLILKIQLIIIYYISCEYAIVCVADG